MNVQDRGTSLASNQVQYSLLYRAPEKNGVKQACEEGGTSLIAYSPLAQGLLTGLDCSWDSVYLGVIASSMCRQRTSVLLCILSHAAELQM